MGSGSNYGSSSSMKNLISSYKMAIAGDFSSMAETLLLYIGRSRYAESTKQKAYKECAEYKEGFEKQGKKPC